MNTAQLDRRPIAVVGRPTLTQLARAEIRYALGRRLLWGAVLVHAFLAWAPRLSDAVRGQVTVADEYSLWDHLVAAPLVVAAFLAGNAAALREKAGSTEEMFAPAPARPWDRTVGVLAAAVVPAAMALVVVASQVALIAADGGIPFGDPPYEARLVPTPLELLGIPLFAACGFVSGVALARLVRSRAVGALISVIGALLFFGAFWVWYIAPMAYVALSRNALVAENLGPDPAAGELDRWLAVVEPSRYEPYFVGYERDLVFYAVHLVLVVGALGVLAGIALLRSGRDRRTWWVLAVGAALVVASVAWQVVVFDGSPAWLGGEG